MKSIKGFFIHEKEAIPPHQEQIAIDIYTIKLFLQHPCNTNMKKEEALSLQTINFLRTIHEIDKGCT
jgi:hypothetical protein